MSCLKKPPVSKFLGHLPLKKGAVFTGHLMFGVFTVCGLGFFVLTAWWAKFYDGLVAILGTTKPGANTNGMLDALHPMAMGVTTTVFLLYAITSLMLLYGIKKRISALVRLFLVSTISTITFCITGHIIIFTAFEWHDVKQLVVVIIVNLSWYIWWTYSLVVVLSYYVHKRESEVLEAGGRCISKESLNVVDLPQPPQQREYVRHSHISSDEVIV